MNSSAILLGALLLAPLGLLAQKAGPAAKSAHPATAKPAAAKPVATKVPTPAGAASAAEANVPAAPIALAPVTPPADPNALKIKTEQNPIAHTLTVRCDAPGPTRFEINDKDGRPVLTKNVMVGTSPLLFHVASLPAGPYVVRCTASEKKGMRLIQLGN